MTLEQIFTGGPIRPVVGAPRVEAVLTRGDRIVAVGSLADCEAQSTGHELVDLAGHTMLPGFVDAHTHPLMLGQCASWADLTGAASVDEVVKILREHGNDVPDGESIRGFGYDHHKLGSNDSHPTAADLDRVSETDPVEIMHASGHGYVVNSVSLSNAGITAATPTPDGGRIDRGDDGEPTGVIFDSACDLLTGPDGVKIENHGPNLHLPEEAETLDRMLLLGQQMLNEAGITSVGDCQVTEREMTNWLRCRDHGRLSLRVSMMILSSHLPHLRRLGLSATLGDDLLRIAGVKLYTDGALTAGMAYVPCGCPTNHRPGRLYHDEVEFTELLGAAHELGFQTGTHAQGPEAIQMVIDAIAAAQRRSPRRDVRHRIEHCGFPSEDQIAEMARHEILPVPQPTHVYQYGEGARRDYGEITEGMYPSGRFAAAGIPVVLSSDVPVSMPDVFLAMWAAVTRRTASGKVIGPECAVDRLTALAGYTIEGARALHREHVVGSIEPGKLADFAIVDRDPITCDLDDVPDIGVVQTWLAGAPVG
ncbi:MAG: amidohydrolase [Acidimicrobiales bacterium]|nr:amidohydrolase [Acidimicrobiales bacterium]